MFTRHPPGASQVYFKMKQSSCGYEKRQKEQKERK
jgi:hypothetical protein